jgi:hypothetical protein
VTLASSGSGSGDFSLLPPLDGTLVTNPASLAAIADDFGHMIHRTPVAIPRPGHDPDNVLGGAGVFAWSKFQLAE